MVGAFSTAMRVDNEAILIWAIPDFAAWADFERGATADQALLDWKDTINGFGAFVERTLMVDAPLAPLRTGRQPQVEDRRPLARDLTRVSAPGVRVGVEEAVADARLGDEHRRAVGPELLAELARVDAQVVGLGVVPRPPHLVEQGAVGEDPPGVAGEQRRACRTPSGVRSRCAAARTWPRGRARRSGGRRT